MKRTIVAVVPLALLAGCEAREPAPPPLWYEGLPVRGSVADARRAGFTECIQSSRPIRCRRAGVMIAGQGPFRAAVDLRYGDGSGGFHQLTLWHDEDQRAVTVVGDVLEKQGWTLCRTAWNENQGDQKIYTKAGARVRFSIDLSYWSKRRLRILPEQNQPIGRCW